LRYDFRVRETGKHRARTAPVSRPEPGRTAKKMRTFQDFLDQIKANGVQLEAEFELIEMAAVSEDWPADGLSRASLAHASKHVSKHKFNSQ
jgi:hypothetical protein